jgi:hypothetical protein
MTNSPLVNVIGLTTPLKVIVLPAHASLIACRNDPAPLSAFVETVGSVTHPTVVPAVEVLFSEVASFAVVLTVATLL